METLKNEASSKPNLNPHVCPSSSLFAPVILVTILSVYTLFVFFNKDDIPTFENLLLALIFVVVLIFFAQRNKGLIHNRFNLVKQFYNEHAKKLGLSKNQSKVVQWFIGESNLGGKKERKEFKWWLATAVVANCYGYCSEEEI